RRRELSFPLLLLMVFSCFATAQTRDYWLKMERKGTGFGYEHITVRQVENGYFEYHFDQHQKTDIAGFNPQDIIQKVLTLWTQIFYLSPLIFMPNLGPRMCMSQENMPMA
ncbi:MAG: hypothetical protein ACE5KJ_08360, partial [Candidatus Zixiibacteriota bacterium]